MKSFELLYRVLDKHWEVKEDSFVCNSEMKSHTGKTVNLVIGMTSSGKTSMIQILAGGDQTVARTKSETQSPVLVSDEVNDKLWLDTAGMCDSSNDSDRKAQLRDAVITAVKEHKFSIGRIFVCVASDQNMDVEFAHEFTAFKDALPPSYCVTRIVITKVNRQKTADQINSAGGLKAKYASAFNCAEGQVLLHGYDQFNEEVMKHAVGPSYKDGNIRHNNIGDVTENQQLVRMIQELKDQLNKSNSVINTSQCDKMHTEEKMRELYNTIDAAEQTLDHLLSTNHCGKNNHQIQLAYHDISRLRADLADNERKLHSNEVSVKQVSIACDRLHAKIDATKSKLEARMRDGVGLAVLAGAKNAFVSFFGNV